MEAAEAAQDVKHEDIGDGALSDGGDDGASESGPKASLRASADAGYGVVPKTDAASGASAAASDQGGAGVEAEAGAKEFVDPSSCADRAEAIKREARAAAGYTGLMEEAVQATATATATVADDRATAGAGCAAAGSMSEAVKAAARAAAGYTGPIGPPPPPRRPRYTSYPPLEKFGGSRDGGDRRRCEEEVGRGGESREVETRGEGTSSEVGPPDADNDQDEEGQDCNGARGNSGS